MDDTELFILQPLAVKAEAKAVAEQGGDRAFARYVAESLFLFLEAEQERAEAEGGA